MPFELIYNASLQLLSLTETVKTIPHVLNRMLLLYAEGLPDLYLLRHEVLYEGRSALWSLRVDTTLLQHSVVGESVRDHVKHVCNIALYRPQIKLVGDSVKKFCMLVYDLNY